MSKKYRILNRIFNSIGHQPPFKIIFQADETECGLASLTMIFNIFGIKTSLEELRMEFGSTRGGMTIGEICKFALKYGLNAFPQRITVHELNQLPSIIFARGEHFSVLWKIDNMSYFIADPSDGNLILNKDEFNKYFSNIVIGFKKNHGWISADNLNNQGTDNGLSPSLIDLFFSRKTIVIILSLLALVAAILSLFNAAIQDVFMTYIVEEGLLLWTNGLIRLTIVTSALVAISGLLIQLLAQQQLQTVLKTWNIEIFESLFRAPYAFFINKTSGLITSRFNQLDESFTGYQTAILSSITGILNLLIYIIAVTLVSIPLSVISLLGILSFLVVGFKFIGINIQNNYLKREAECKISSSEFKLINGRSQIVLENADKAISRELATNYGILGQAELNTQRVEIANEFYLSLVDQSLNLFLLIISSILIVKGHLSTGTYAAVNVIIGTALEPIRSLASIIETLQNSQFTFDAVNELYQNKSSSRQSSPVEIDDKAPIIEIKDLCFSYSLYSEQLFNGLNVKIGSKSGQTIAVKVDGSSGSGKSTFFNVIMGLVKPNSGKIYVCGIDIQNHNISQLRKYIQYLDRNVVIVRGSVEMNSRLGTHGNHEQFEEVIDILGLSSQSIFSQQNQRYLNSITSLSTGQSIMIALVRVALIKPKLLLIDEALISIPEYLHETIIMGLKKLGINILVIQHGNDSFVSKLPTFSLNKSPLNKLKEGLV